MNWAIRRSVGPPADSLYRPDTIAMYAFHHNNIFVVYNKTKQWAGVHVRESFLNNTIHRKPVQMSLFQKHHKIISCLTIIYSFNVRKGFRVFISIAYWLLLPVSTGTSCKYSHCKYNMKTTQDRNSFLFLQQLKYHLFFIIMIIFLLLLNFNVRHNFNYTIQSTNKS